MSIRKASPAWGIACSSALFLGCAAGQDPQSGDDDFLGSEAAALAPPPVGGSWAAFTNAAPGGLGTCLQLTDGDVMCHGNSTNVWHRLRPNAFGSYKNGTWDNPPIPPMPNNSSGGIYAPLYFASAVLKDGRAVIIGGEYNSGVPTEQNVGFIYDPATNTWSSQLQEPIGSLGDAASITFQDGTLAIFNVFTSDVEVLNPVTGVFTSKNSTGKLDSNSEENPVPLYDGTVLAVDSRIPSSFERYNPTTNTWGNSGSMPVNLADTGTGSGESKEVGPCAFRPDNQVMCFSGNSLGQNAVYNPSNNTWTHTASMDFPVSSGTSHFSMADGPAAALPNGNILVLASPVSATSTFNKPSHFYEVAFATNTLSAVADTPNVSTIESYNGRLMLLPTGEVLYTGSDTMLYTATGGPSDSWRPAITTAPTSVSGGASYSISGRLFNGFSEGGSYGDDAQSSTNYPLVRITNTASGHVFYAKTSNHSRMGIEPVGSTTVVSTNFRVPASIENGPATLQVVANGIASLPQSITVSAACTVAADCNDNNACTTDTCTTGVCGNAAVANGTVCNDGNASTCNDSCSAGVCTGVTCGSQPYGGTPRSVTSTIQAEDYDTGGEGVAFHDSDTTNSGGQYRTDSVDIGATTDTGGGFNVGWTNATEYLKYSVTAASAGTYTLNMRVASAAAQTFHVEVDGTNVSGTMNVNTGGWQNWTTATKAGVNLTAGAHVVKVVFDSGNMNLNWFRFAAAGGCAVAADCNDNNPCTVDACNTGTCSNVAGNAGATCRASAGACDVAEACTGSTSACPADAFTSNTTVCRAASGQCDLAEKCTGSSAACPADAFAANGTACAGGTCNGSNMCVTSGSTPCAGLCSPIVTKTGPSIQSGNLTTSAICHEVAGVLNGGNCSNMTGRNLTVNGATMSCGGWALPAQRNGGYCIQVTSGGLNYASYSTW
jgi:carbohydrate binding protein with CBM35 domain